MKKKDTIMESKNSQDYQKKQLKFDEQKYITELLEKEDLDVKIFSNEDFNYYLPIKANKQCRKKIKGSLEPLW